MSRAHLKTEAAAAGPLARLSGAGAVLSRFGRQSVFAKPYRSFAKRSEGSVQPLSRSKPCPRLHILTISRGTY